MNHLSRLVWLIHTLAERAYNTGLLQFRDEDIALLCSAVAPQTPVLYYSYANLSALVPVAQAWLRWRSRRAPARLRRGREPGAQLHAHVRALEREKLSGWASSPVPLHRRRARVHEHNAAARSRPNAVRVGQLPTWAALNASALGVREHRREHRLHCDERIRRVHRRLQRQPCRYATTRWSRGARSGGCACWCFGDVNLSSRECLLTCLFTCSRMLTNLVFNLLLCFGGAQLQDTTVVFEKRQQERRMSCLPFFFCSFDC